jgi:FKBP-type peptidyl-prolyl cis-trans isomerase SlyD
MKIQKNHVVSLHYTLTEDTDEGELLEETYNGEPLSFIFGTGMMLPGFEEHLEDKATGDTFSFVLEPEDAYGDYEEQAVVNIPRSNFTDENGAIDTEKIQPGAPITMHDQNGREFHGVIAELNSDAITVDFNHPMSGRTLCFKGEILDVREATPSELDHGHIHHGGLDHD